MELLFLLALLLGVAISAIGTLLWWFGIALAAKRAIGHPMHGFGAAGQTGIQDRVTELTGMAAGEGIDLSR